MVFYILRGTKTKPDEGLEKALERLAKAQSEYESARSDVVSAHDAFVTVTKYEKETHEDNGDNAEHEVLMDVIQRLQQRVEQLEEAQTKAEKKTVKSADDLKRTVSQFVCGGIAGAVSRTSVAPIDRVKILLQTQFLTQKGNTKYTSLAQTCRTIVFEEGVTRLWRGNMTNMARVFPYAATQFTSYDFYKGLIVGKDKDRELKNVERLCAGALAGMTATSLTHPLDVIRLRLAVEPDLKNALDACRSIKAEGGMRTFFKGYVPTLLSLSPFIGINFATFDILKKTVYPDGNQSTIGTLALGACAGLFAQTCCFPLDTVRRRMQLKGTTYNGTIDAFKTIRRVEGFGGFYKGMLPNAIKVIPNNAVRFLVFDFLTKNAASPFFMNRRD